jgi:hypothetical protein
MASTHQKLAAASERLIKETDSGEGVDDVEDHLDWEVLTIGDPIVFVLAIKRGMAHSSAVRFQIELAKLDNADLERFHDLLATRPKGYWLTRSVVWLLGISLTQQQPALSEEGRCAEVRELLLSRQ